MQLKKLLQGSAFALVAAACAIAAPSVVKAADVTGTTTESKVGTLAVDGEKAQLSITSATDKEVLVGIAKVNAKGKVTVASWDTYDGTGASTSATVDLSKLSNVKDNYIAVTTPTALADDIITIVKIPATKKVFKAEFDASSATMSVGEAASGKPTLAALSKTDTDTPAAKDYEYRTAYSAWASMKDTTKADVVDLKLYQEEGTTLFVRKKGVKETSFPGTQGSDTYTFGKQEKLKAYESTSTLPGKEAKVAIKARAKGPAVSGDYVKGTIKLPKGAEYRLLGANLETATAGKYNEVGAAAKTVTINDIIGATGTSTNTAVGTNATFDVEVRIAADATKKKAASKWSRLNVTKPADVANVTAGDTLATPKTTAGTLPTQTAAEQKSEGNGVKGALVKKAAGDNASVLEIKYVTKGKIKAEYYTANAIEIENKGDKTYEILGSAKGTTTAPTDTKGIMKVAPGKKIVMTGVEDGGVLWIREAGDKKNKVWVSNLTKLGTVDYPFTIPAKAATTT